ncbi:hypothetical protein ACR77J_07880 [Tissierella praeacuta]|uniref:hypothetical protein n=1 Tax=Tissierella praeacuta TaxID=43131 RepID=UPI003DA24A71
MLNVKLMLINDYADSSRNGEIKTIECSLDNNISVAEIENYICDKFELNLEDMWKIVKKFKTTQTDLIKYNNLECLVLRELDKTEYDKEDLGYCMYEIQLLENNKIIQVFEDELI